MDSANTVYPLTKAFTECELGTWTAQFQCSAISVASNMATEQDRTRTADFKRFLSIAHGSQPEAETLILFAKRFGYATSEQVKSDLGLASKAGKLIHGLANTLNAKLLKLPTACCPLPHAR